MNAVKELFVPFENDSLRLGRLSVFKTHKGFEVHVDIVFEETRKIYQHISIIQGMAGEQEEEVIQTGLIALRQKVAVK